MESMQPKECFYKDQFGYCWLADRRWMFQALDAAEKPVGDPISVDLHEIVFHHDQDEKMH
ncbi:MAG: hypothetical protein ROZ09_06045 [Thiobacillus sp.]|jgi:hypothetical protein|uniref:hypothetical protein n=1 Tax=Thiobacillus sp. TaxID=924 RepID=UPI0028959017|nr:hypothetical protein [Thiobacillus sp.]MDT3706370.1 hypothetical protein [Thiobacillus sp.]